MISRLACKLVLWVLKRTDLSVRDRNLCTSQLLTSLHAAPLAAIIRQDEQGAVFVSGQELNFEQARALREYAISALKNHALSLVREQVRWIGIVEGLSKGRSPEDLLFYRAAMWFCDQELNLLTRLSGSAQELPL